MCLSIAMNGMVLAAGKSTNAFRINQDDLTYTSKPAASIQLTASEANSTVELTSEVKWQSSNPNVATIGTDGKLTFTGYNGTSMITASYGKSSASVKVTMNSLKTLLDIRLERELSDASSQFQLAVMGNYSTHSYERVTSGITWTSSNPGVAIVDNNGMVYFTGKNGLVEVTAKIGNLSITTKADVKHQVSNLTLEAPDGTFAYSPYPITLILKDNGVPVSLDKAVWTSSNTNVATVNKGVVTFKGGTSKQQVVITASYGDATASISTPVSNVVESIKIVGSISYNPNPSQLYLEATYTDGTKQNIKKASWSSNATSIATIDSNGVITYKGTDGQVTITATYGDKSASISGNIVNGFVVKSIRINESLTYSSGTVKLSLTGTLVNNTTQSIDPSSATWTSSDSTIATVNSKGELNYKGRNGYLTITATYKGKTATQHAYIDRSTGLKEIEINENLYYSSSTVRLTLKGKLNNGNTYDISSSSATWKSSDTSIANVDSSGNVWFTGKNGNVTISATYGGMTDTVSAYIDSTIDIYDLRINESLYYSTTAVPLTLTATDRNGYEEAVPASKASWKSSDTAIANVNSSGHVTFTGREGIVTITATYGNRSATQSEYITTGSSIDRLEINEPLFYSPFRVPLTLTSTHINGTTQSIPSTSAVWSSSNTSIATVNRSGEVSYKGKSGSVTITATYSGRVATQTANIDATNTIAGIEIDGDLFYSTTPISLQLKGSFRDGNTQVIPVSSVSWSSSDTNIATVNNGKVTFKGRNGSVTITAKYGNLEASVTGYIDTSITLKQLLINETLSYSTTPVPLTLTGVFSNDSRQTISPSSAVWRSSDTSIATVSNNGLVSYKGKSGSVTITATYAGRVATVQGNISTSATLNMLKINETLTYSKSPVILTLTGTLLNGTTQNISANSATWASSNTSIATVSKGVVTFTGKAGYVSISASYGGRAASVTTTVSTTGSSGSTDPINNPFTVTVNNAEVENRIVNKVRTIKPLHTIANYPDAGNHWASREIKLGKELEIVSGYPDGTFKPNNNVTRAEFVIMITRSFAIPVGSGSFMQFNDISDSFAKNQIMSLYNLGIINGYQDGTFKPNSPITRAEVVTILSKLINFSKVPATGTANFTDTGTHWANTQINQIAYTGVVSGKSDGIFAPNDNTTRAEAISLLLRTLSLNSNIEKALGSL